MLITNNIYYVLFYLFLEIIYFGLILSLFQLEFFTGFLWVVEFTAIFIIIILLFYLNIEGVWSNFKLVFFKFNFFIFFFIFFFSFLFYFFSEVETYIPSSLNIIDVWDDFYEACYNSLANDFTALLLSYYSLNSFEFICVGILFLVGSVVCIFMVQVLKKTKSSFISNYLNIFNFFKDFVSYIFLRKQNLTTQSNNSASTRIFKKKTEW